MYLDNNNFDIDNVDTYLIGPALVQTQKLLIDSQTLND